MRNSSLKIKCLTLDFQTRVSHARFLSAFLNGKIESIRLELLEMKIVWKVAQLIILFRVYSYLKKNSLKLHYQTPLKFFLTLVA